MKKWLVCLAILASASNASAQCLTLAEARPDSTCVVMPREGVRGVWFELAEADRLRRAHLELGELRLQVAAMEQLRVVWATRADQYREAATLRGEAAEVLERQLNEALARTEAARADADAWWRQPALWFGLGAVVAVVVFIAVGAT